MALRDDILAVLVGSEELTATTIASALRVPVSDVVAELNAMRGEQVVIRRVGDPAVPMGRDRSVARWSRA